LTWRDANQALEMMAKLALVREPNPHGNIRQRLFGPRFQDLPGSFDAAGDYEMMRRHSSGLLELPGEVISAEAGDRGHLLQARAGTEVFLDVLDDGPEPSPRQHTVSPALRPARRLDVPD
jgi:hypothetical protein